MSRLEVNPEQEFHVVIQGQQTALSLDALAEAYEADVITETTLIWQPSFPSWLPLARVLAELDSEDEAQGTAVPSLPPGMYQVSVAPGDVRQLTYEQVKDALRLGALDPDALVWQAGYTEWLPVSAVLAERSSLEHVSVHPSAPNAGVVMSSRPAPRSGGPGIAPSPPSMYAPDRNTIPGPSMTPAPPSARPAPRNDGPSLAPQAPSMRPSLRSDGPSVAPAAPSGRPAPRNDGPSLAPQAPSMRPAARVDGPLSQAPISAGPGSLAPHGSLPARTAASLAPPSLTPYDLSRLEAPDDVPFAKAKKSRWPAGGVVVLAAAVTVFALYRNGVGGDVASAELNAAGVIAPDAETPEGMKAWLEKVNGKGPSDLAPASDKSNPSTSSNSSSSSGLKLTELPKEEPSAAAESPSSTFGNLLKGKKEAPAPKAKATRPAPVSTKTKKSATKASGQPSDAYDPMNGTL